MIFDFLMGTYGYRCFYYDSGKLVEVKTVQGGVEAVETKHKAHDGDFLFAGEWDA